MAKSTRANTPDVPPSEMEAEYQRQRCTVSSSWYPCPGGVKQHERRTRAYLRLFQTLSR